MSERDGEVAKRTKLGGSRPRLSIVETAKLESATFQVLPLSAGRAALQPMPFTVFKFEGETDPDVAFTEGLGGTIPYESEREVKRCNRLFEHISRSAPSPEDSVALLLRRVEGL